MKRKARHLHGWAGGSEWDCMRSMVIVTRMLLGRVPTARRVAGLTLGQRMSGQTRSERSWPRQGMWRGLLGADEVQMQAQRCRHASSASRAEAASGDARGTAASDSRYDFSVQPLQPTIASPAQGRREPAHDPDSCNIELDRAWAQPFPSRHSYLVARLLSAAYRVRVMCRRVPYQSQHHHMTKQGEKEDCPASSRCLPNQ